MRKEVSTFVCAHTRTCVRVYDEGPDARGNSGGWGVGDKTWCSSIIFVPAIYFPYFCSLFIVSVFKLLHDFSSFYFCKKHI